MTAFCFADSHGNLGGVLPPSAG